MTDTTIRRDRQLSKEKQQRIADYKTDQGTKQIPGDKYGMMRPCSRRAVQDGLCGQHQPEALAARHERQLQKDKIKNVHSPWTQLANAKARIKFLEDENARVLMMARAFEDDVAALKAKLWAYKVLAAAKEKSDEN
jgi:hypothetical protein